MAGYTPTQYDLLLMQNMDASQQEAYLQNKQKQSVTQAGILAGASLVDIFQGRKSRKEGEEAIEEGGAKRDAVIEAIKAVKSRNFADLSPEAERNAAIILKDRTPPTSSELAAAEMALRAGADPASVQRALTESEERKEETERAREEGAFREGMGQAQRDEQIAIQKLMTDLGLDYQTAQEMIQMGQQQSLMGQQQSGAGWQNMANAAMRYLGSGGGDKLKERFKRDGSVGDFGGYTDESAQYIFDTPGENPADYENIFSGMSQEDFLQNLGVAGYSGFEPGGVYTDGEEGMVIKTPGEFSHDSNPIDVMRGGAKIAEMTGGEFVINPDQAAGMEDAYGRAKKNPSKKNLMELFNAVRFIDEPQFD
jgi:hypothetical protein|tara:strand:+ start:839 stop:1936 length:1098 start_codon:yes stop_codon:yes gene_type:complete